MAFRVGLDGRCFHGCSITITCFVARRFVLKCPKKHSFHFWECVPYCALHFSCDLLGLLALRMYRPVFFGEVHSCCSADTQRLWQWSLAVCTAGPVRKDFGVASWFSDTLRCLHRLFVLSWPTMLACGAFTFSLPLCSACCVAFVLTLLCAKGCKKNI